jgi:hypothetical protein
MTKAHSTALVSVLAAALVAACGHSYSQTSSTTTTAARPSAPVHPRAIDALASARCEREARCDNIGPNRRYVSRDGCMTQLKGEEMNALTASSCPSGIDQPQLDRCVAEVRGERCENILDSIDRLANCNTNSLCSR